MRGVRVLASLSVLGAALFVGGGSASAQTSRSCTITVTPMSFGVYDVFSATPLTATGSVTYYCGRHVPSITIWMNKGNYGASNNPRQMASGSNRLSYYLCQNANCNTLWGDQWYPTAYGPVAPITRQNVTLNIYGRILASQDVPVGSYMDSVLVTINF